jgi:peptidoglycan/xylan/chitin deacetylase (PgdA/CDA1 family)
MLKKVVARVFSKIPLPILASLARGALVIPYYHVVSDEAVVHVKHLYKYKTVSQFRSDLDYLLKYYTPIGLLDILDRIRAGCQFPERVFLLTFDDGFREMSDIVAPILFEKGLTATFFVNSAFVDNQDMCYLNKASLLVEQFQKNWSSELENNLSKILRCNHIRFDDVSSGILSVRYQQSGLLDEMAPLVGVDFGDYLKTKEPYLTTSQINKMVEGGFTIGAHSVDHPLYSSLSLEEQIGQTRRSVGVIRERFNLNYGAFAFPHNDDGVSREFFLRISESGLVDLSFGTSGLIDEDVPNHFQRFSLENPNNKARDMIAFQYARRMAKMLKLSRANNRR